MPPEDNSLCINCPDCLKNIHVGTGGQKNLQQHQNGEECRKEQQRVKQRKKLAAQRTLLYMGRHYIDDLFITGAFTKAVETRSGRKRKVVAAEEIYGGCLCDHTPTEAEIEAGAALKCAHEGCETGWVCTIRSSSLPALIFANKFHLECVGLMRMEKGWMCETDLRRKRRGRQGE